MVVRLAALGNSSVPGVHYSRHISGVYRANTGFSIIWISGIGNESP